MTKKHTCLSEALRKEMDTMNELQEHMDDYTKYLEGRIIELEEEYSSLEGRLFRLEKQIDLLQTVVLSDRETESTLQRKKKKL